MISADQFERMHLWMPLVRTGTGSEVYTRVLAQGLQDRGHTVTIDEVAHAYQYMPWLAPIRPPADTDIVFANSWNAAAFARRGLPTISVCHLVVHVPELSAFKSAAQAAFHSHFVKPMERAAVRKAALNVAVSPTVAGQMRQLFDAKNVHVIENGVDTSFFCPPSSSRPARKSEHPLQLLFVGKPSLRKGFDIIAKIVDCFGDQVDLTCVGEKPAGDLPIPKAIYTGFLDKEGVREAYRSADLLLFPSRMEGYGLAAAEAMACGLPVACCVNTAVDDLIPDGGGIIRSPDDIEGFVADIGLLLDDVERLAQMRKMVRLHATEHLTQIRWIGEMEKAMKGLLSAQGHLTKNSLMNR
ncbi:MAG: glycosyltransferase family 4 protein [Erythrobacter sp.]